MVRPNLPDLDKAWFSACVVFDMTEYEFNELTLKRANKLTNKVAAIFATPPSGKPAKRIGWYVLNYDLGEMTFGQYVELSYYLSKSPIQSAHLVLASISRPLFRKHKTEQHKRKAKYFLTVPVEKITGSLNLLITRFESFTKEYKSLFGLDRETNGDVQTDPFNKKYGWIYSASQIAEYERITLEQAFALPVRQAFNDLAYLKAKSKYEVSLLNRK